MRLPAPPASDVTSTELQWVKECATQRDAATLAQIHYWDAGSPAYRWMQIALQAVQNANLPAPLQTRALALIAAAISDATVAAWDSKYAYNRKHPSDLDPTVAPVVAVPQSPSYPSEHAATAGAAAAVLSYLFPAQAAAFADMANQAATSRVMAGVAFPSDAFAGLDLGQSVGQAAIAYAQTDGSNQVFSGSFPPAPGVWSSPTPVSPLAGTWKTWVLGTAQDLRLAAPPAFGSDAANAQYAMEKNLVPTNATNHWHGSGNLVSFSRGCNKWTWRFSKITSTSTLLGRREPMLTRPSRSTMPRSRAGIRNTRISSCGLRRRTPPSFRSSPFRNIRDIPRGTLAHQALPRAVMSLLFPSDQQAFSAMANEAGNSTFDALIHTPFDVSQGLLLGSEVGQKVIARAQADGAN